MLVQDSLQLRFMCARAVLALALAFATPSSHAQELIPREKLFQDRALRDPRLSPNGLMLAYIAASTTGIDNIWIRTVGSHDDRLLTHESAHGVPSFDWAGNSRLIYDQDSNGDENYHVLLVDIYGKHLRDLTPYPGIRAQNILQSPARPGEILVGLNTRDRRFFDMYRIDLASGKMSLAAENPGDVLSWTTDSKFRIRAATAFDPTSGDTIVRLRDTPSSAWRELARWSFENSLMFGQISGGQTVAGFGPNDDSLYVISAADSDMGNLVRLDAHTGHTLETLASDPLSDVAVDPSAAGYAPLVMIGPRSHQVEAVGFEYQSWSWRAIDARIGADLDWLADTVSGFPIVVSRDGADGRWIVEFLRDNSPPAFYLVDRRARSIVPLLSKNGSSTDERWVSAKRLVIQARDGLELVSYLTLPRGQTVNLPLVLYPHGGPWYRDDWGFDPVVQLLADRGYAVLQVNFRGSTGFGKRFLNAGNHQFGLAMQDDIEDAVRWAIDKGTADSKRVAIMGYSAGGYATLRGLTRTPALYACGVDIVGPADLGTLLSSFAPWMKAVKTRWIRRLGDVENDAELRRQLSPLYDADKIQVPLLIGQGEQDPRVSIAQSDAMVAALRSHHVDVKYLVYPDEGHGFSRPENNLDFVGHVEEFLGTCLHGNIEPWRAVSGSSAQVR